MIELHFAPGACSFVPHVGLERIRQDGGADFTPRLVKLHKGEQRTAEFLSINPNGQVPVLIVDGKPLHQIVAICDWLDRANPGSGLLPTDAWARAQALSQLAWMNNTVHPTFTHVFMPNRFADDEQVQQAIRAHAAVQYRGLLERVASMIPGNSRFWAGEQPGFHDAYAFTLLRWGGYAGIEPASVPGLHAHVLRVMEHPAVAAVIERERVGLDTYKG